VVIYLERGADCLHIVQLMLLHRKPHHLLPHLNSDWFYFSGTGLPRLSWKRGRQTEVVVVLVVSNVFGSTSSRGWPSNSIAALSTEHWAAAAAAAAAAVVVSSLGRSARACVARVRTISTSPSMCHGQWRN